MVGPVCTPDEVRDLLQPYGNIEYCYTASPVERTALDLGEGVIVQFELYDDGQNAYSVSFSISHSHFKLMHVRTSAAMRFGSLSLLRA
jgi:hypothetical protein